MIVCTAILLLDGLGIRGIDDPDDDDGDNMVPEMSVIFNLLSRLVARENFINVVEYFRQYETDKKE